MTGRELGESARAQARINEWRAKFRSPARLALFPPPLFVFRRRAVRVRARACGGEGAGRVRDPRSPRGALALRLHSRTPCSPAGEEQSADRRRPELPRAQPQPGAGVPAASAHGEGERGRGVPPPLPVQSLVDYKVKLTRDNKSKDKQGGGEAPHSGLPTGPPEDGRRGMPRGGDAGTARYCCPTPARPRRKGDLRPVWMYKNGSAAAQAEVK